MTEGAFPDRKRGCSMEKTEKIYETDLENVGGGTDINMTVIWYVCSEILHEEYGPFTTYEDAKKKYMELRRRPYTVAPNWYYKKIAR